MSVRVSPLWLLIVVLCCTGAFFDHSAEAQDEPVAEITAEVSGPTTIFLVRHAEKVRGPDVGRDPALTEAGRARGRALAMTLADAGVDAMYTTQWRRTRETAAELARRLDIQPEVIATEEGFIEHMRDLLLEHRGQTVVVVGHSDTTPELARALGVDGVPDIQDDDFDDLYQVVLTDTTRHFVHLRYGHPTP